MDMGLSVICPLARLGMPRIRFLFVGSRLCSTLLSDTPSRDRCPCASLCLHLHPVGKGTPTPKLSNMPSTQRERPNTDVGARRYATDPNGLRRKSTGEGTRSVRFHARASIPLTVLAWQIPFCLVGMRFRLRSPAISRKDSPPARYCLIIRIAACSTPFFTSWWFR